ncbi:MAG: FAD-binding protein [Actinobacteria bacterium]|nr:FAD-binding protein [Actinomycetota bacterium]
MPRLASAPPPVSPSAFPAAELIGRLRAICGDEHVLTHAHDLRTYQSDGLLHYHVVPPVAVLPADAAEVHAVVRACYELKVPWVARGAGSGLSGGALPIADGVLLVLSRMRRVLEVDLANQRVVVEPGVTNIAISHAVAPGYFFPPDPSSQIVCSIGGNVAENSGGAHCFKYGFTTNYVTGLEVVLTDGSVVELGGKHLDPTGYDLLGAFVGSEGTLGVATRITLRVVPTPETVKTLVAFFPDTRSAGGAVSAIVSAGLVPAAIEMMDALAIHASEQMAHAGWPTDAGAALLVELDGPREECEARFEELETLCRESESTGVRVAGTAAERAVFWKMRKSAFPAAGRISSHYFVQDGVVPRTRLPDVLGRIEELGREYGLRVANVFHAGDGNLHPLVCYDGHVPGEAARAEELSGLILQACLDAGGSITGEHGVGVDKRAYMGKMFNEADLAAFQMLRCAFDPDGLANPGKVMPTPRLCGEVPGPYRVHPLEAAGLAERF